MFTIRDLRLVVYEAVTPIKLFNGVPRFGHTYITDIFQNGQVDSDTAIYYVLGSMFITGICLIVFVTWILVLFLCKILGKRAGIHAGYPFEENETANVDLINIHRRQMLTRILMTMASIAIIAAGCVFNFKGTQSISSLLINLQDGTTGLIQLNELVDNTGSDLLNFIETTIALKANIVQSIGDGICVERGYYDPIIVEEVISFLNSLQDFGDAKLTYLRDTFSEVFETMIHTMITSISIAEKYVRPIFIAAPVVVLGFILALGLVLTLRNRGNRVFFTILTSVVLPVFFIIVLLLGLCTSIIGFAAVANTDICLGGGGSHENGSPEGTVERIVQSEGLEGLAIESINYYVINGCEGDFSPKTYVKDLVDYISIGQDTMGDIHTMMQTEKGMDILEGACGGEGLHPIKDALSDLNASMEEFVRVSESAMDVLNCEDVNAIFVDIVHRGMCENLPYLFLWAFSTWSLIFICGAMMILFRGALLPTMYGIDEESTLGETVSLNDLTHLDTKMKKSTTSRQETNPENNFDDLELHPIEVNGTIQPEVTSPVYSQGSEKLRGSGIADQWWYKNNRAQSKVHHEDIDEKVDVDL